MTQLNIVTGSPLPISAPKTKHKAGPIDVHVGGKLHARRTARKMSQQKLSEHLDVAYQQIGRYESGEVQLCPTKLVLASRALGVPVSFFFEGIQQGAEQ